MKEARYVSHLDLVELLCYRIDFTASPLKRVFFARRSVPLARMIQVCGYTAIDPVRNFENRGMSLALRAFKALARLVGPYLVQCARYMQTPRATGAGLANIAWNCQREMRLSWDVMHPNCAQDLVHPSPSMLWRTTNYG